MRRKQMMKKRTILLFMAIIGCMINGTAQDVTILHMKNGTTKRYTNGVKEKTSIEFYEYTPTNTYQTGISQYYGNGYTATWDVNQVFHINDEYVVGLLWEDNVPINFCPTYGVCLGTKPGLTVENCEEKAYSTDATDAMASSEGHHSYNFSAYTNSNTHYMWIGGVKDIYLSFIIDQRTVITPDTTINFIKTTLQKGQTYYYRTFAEGKMIENGQEKNIVFYGDEHSFRVPRVMEDFGYYSQSKGTKEAIEAFAVAHFPEGTPIPTWQQLGPLWNKWRATDEGKSIDLSADITTEQFDNGTGYCLNRIPDEFYTWMANRDIVIDPFDWADIDKTKDYSYIDSVYLAEGYFITDVDAKWGVPGGKYTRFLPTSSTTNYMVTYRSNETVPGVRYKLQFNFAPETDTLATVVERLPTKIRVYTVNREKLKQIPLPTDDSKNTTTIPTTEVTTIEVENFSTESMGLNLQIQTQVSNVEYRKELFNRILRVAEIRLSPIKNE